MTKILLVEDHPVMRAGTRTILHSFLGNCQITEVDNFKRAINAIIEEEFSLVILDVSIPGGESVKMIENIKSRRSEQKVLVYTSWDENLYALEFIKAGANGYLTKDASEAELKVAVETIIFQNKMYLSQNVRDQGFNMFIKSGKTLESPQEQLSLREREVVNLFLTGKSVSEVSSLLSLHPSTVSTHRHRIFQKLGVNNMMDLAKKLGVLH
ncbi:response regulator [Dyadobacter sp. BHUBP1]|uniref:response regulator n=1 Tax=Dyadobacter sp. BHUBP1 TaxID=3424178 RepID=UPI003D3263CB